MAKGVGRGGRSEHRLTRAPYSSPNVNKSHTTLIGELCIPRTQVDNLHEEREE